LDADQATDPTDKSSAQRLASGSTQSSDQADRIVAVCPGCHATLSVRRAYVGSDVKCKNCGHIFPIAPPPDAQSKPVEDRKREELLDEHGLLMALYGPPEPKQDQLEIEHGRLAPAQDELDEQLGPTTSERNAIRTSSGEQLPGPSAQRSSRADRIDAVCPGCQTSLRVRRAYIGSDVKCKRCAQIFRVADPADSQSERIEDSKHRHLLDEHGRLMAEHGQLRAKYDQLDVENGRLTTAKNQLTEQLSCVTDEMNAIRAELDLLAPEGVRSLAEQREWLRTEVGRLQEEHRSTHESCKQLQDRALELAEAQKRLETTYQSMLDAERREKAALAQQLDDLRADAAERARLAEELIAANSRQVEERSAADAELKAACANRDLLAGQLKGRESALEASSIKVDQLAGQLKEREMALAASSTELELLARQIKEREIDLDGARAECRRLTCELQTADGEIKTLQVALAERDSALRDQSEQQGAQVESYRRALEHGEHVHEDMITSLEAKLAAHAERLGMLQDEHRSTQESCKQFQDRELELAEAQKRLETTYQSMLDAERREKAALAQQLDELRADAAERARLAEELLAANSRQVEERSAVEAERKATRAYIRELNRLLSESERLSRETAAALNESGVRFHAPISN
jgi:predicted Zn finger-like uncharacterized protein